MSAVSLSDLPRAALAAKESYGWIHVLALLYCVVIGLFSCVAWIEAGEPFRAAVCAGAQTLSVIMALLARRGLTGEMTFAGLACVGIAFGFSVWAAEGLQHAWAVNGAEIEQWQVWFLTGSEPAIFLLIEHIKEGRETLRTAHQKAEREEAEELARIRAKEPPRPVERRLELVETSAAPVASGDFGDAARLAGGVAVASVAAAAPAAALPVDAAAVQPALPGFVSHSEATWASPEAHAKHLIENEGVRQRNVLARRVRGLSTYRAALLLDAYAPGWRPSSAA